MRPRRVLTAGTSGSGKTTLAARIGEMIDAPHVEIDALFHGPGWTERPTFEADVDAMMAQDRWVTEWQYSVVRRQLAERADLIVWIDLPRPQTMRQVIRRTLARRLSRQPLWNGNIEPPLWTIVTDRDHIVRWAWRTHPKSKARIERLLTEQPDYPVVRLRSHDETAAWLDGPLRSAMR